MLESPEKAKSSKITDKEIFRAAGKIGNAFSTSMNATAIWKIVLHYAHRVGIERLTPHDLMISASMPHPRLC
jgi:hypothetical protein